VGHLATCAACSRKSRFEQMKHVDDDQCHRPMALALYIAAAEETGRGRLSKLQGTGTNDLIKEYLVARGTYILPAWPVAQKMIADCWAEYCYTNVPKMEPDERLFLPTCKKPVRRPSKNWPLPLATAPPCWTLLRPPRPRRRFFRNRCRSPSLNAGHSVFVTEMCKMRALCVICGTRFALNATASRPQIPPLR